MTRVIHIAAALVASVAQAGWVEVATSTGTPTDVTVTAEGVVVLATTTGANAWRVSDAGVVLAASVGVPAIGAGYSSAGCLSAVQPSRVVAYSPAACGAAVDVGFGTTAQRFRLTPTLAMAVTRSVINQLYSSPAADGPWTALNNYQSPGMVESLQVARVGGVDVAVANAGLQRFVLSLDGGALTSLSVGADLRDVAPFSRLGSPALMAVLADGGLQLAPSVVAPVLQPVVTPAGAVSRFVSLSGARGLASTAAGGAMSPIPDPSRPGETWVANPAAPALEGRVHCVDGQWCVGMAGQVVWALVNAAAPRVQVPPLPVRFGESVRLFADAGDADGDPVYVSWSTTLGALAPVAGVDDGTQVDLLPNCEAVVPIDVTVTDGFRTALTSVTVPVERRGTPTITGPASLLAGGDAGRFEVTIVGGCLVPTFTWSTPTGQGSTAATLDWVPPATACDVAGTTATLTATATWPGGLGSSDVSVSTLVLPWGAPEAPVFPSPARQRSGTSAVWSATGMEHACEASPNFPRTELRWLLDGGSLAIPVDGGLLVTAPSSCVPSTERFVAQRQVIGEAAGRFSAPGTLVLELTPDFDPLDAGAAFSLSAAGDGGVLAGTLGISADCLSARSLEAEVVVAQAGLPLATGRFPVPGPWALAVPGACAGGQFTVTGALYESGADTQARALAAVTTAPIAAAVGAQTPATVEVQCGTGATAQLSLAPVAGACSTAAYAWRVISGPPLEQSEGQGATAALQSVARDWSGAGQIVRVEWTADAGPGNAVSETRELALVVAPFLSWESRIDPVRVEEESVFRARAIVTNPTACDAAGLSLQFPLSAAVPVEGTARLDGAALPSTWRDGAVGLEGISIPAGGQVTFEVLARPRLLGKPALAASARLNGLLVTRDPVEAPTTSGCGCASGPGGLGLALLGLVRWRRRAARVGCRR